MDPGQDFVEVEKPWVYVSRGSAAVVGSDSCLLPCRRENVQCRRGRPGKGVKREGSDTFRLK